MKQAWRTIAVVLSCLALMVGVSMPHARAEGVTVAEATKKQKTEAKAKYKVGKRHLKAGRYEKAMEAFRASFEIVSSPNALLMIVRTLARAQSDVDAYREGQLAAQFADAAAREHDKYIKTAKAIRDEMKGVSSRIGLIKVEIIGLPEEAPVVEKPPVDEDDPDAPVLDEDDEPPAPPSERKLTVNGVEVLKDFWKDPVPVEPGTAMVVLTAELGTETREVTVKAGELETVQIGWKPPEEKPKPVEEPVVEDKPWYEGGDPSLRVPSYIALGVGGAGMLMFAIFGGLASSTYGDLEDSCPNNACTEDRTDDINSGQGNQTIANVSVGVGAAALTAGAVLFLMGHIDMGGSDEDEQPDEQSTEPQVSFGPGSILVTGRF